MIDWLRQLDLIDVGIVAFALMSVGAAGALWQLAALRRSERREP